MLSEISHPEKDRYRMFYFYVDPEKLNRRPWERGREKKDGEGGSKRETNHKRLLKTENSGAWVAQLRVGLGLRS